MKVMYMITEDGKISSSYDGDHDLGQSTPRKTEFTHPYSFDPYTIWGLKVEGVNGSVYSDRLIQWDYEKSESLIKKHFGTSYPDWTDGKKVEGFLQEWNKDPDLKLTRIIKYCNMSTGFAIYRMDYISSKKVNK